VIAAARAHGRETRNAALSGEIRVGRAMHSSVLTASLFDAVEAGRICASGSRGLFHQALKRGHGAKAIGHTQDIGLSRRPGFASFPSSAGRGSCQRCAAAHGA